MVSMDGVGDAYSYGRGLLKRIGWEIHLGGDRWERVTWVEVRGDDALITVEDGTTFRVGYMDAVRLRRPGLAGICGTSRPVHTACGKTREVMPVVPLDWCFTCSGLLRGSRYVTVR
jgi:hypothetical protein